jgi:hypothetical protein
MDSGFWQMGGEFYFDEMGLEGNINERQVLYLRKSQRRESR